jgi:lipopolysaccharide/colanic/teichoic acid biosynthesis glycosyltransferase
VQSLSMCKRFFDIVTASFGLLLMSPLLFWIAWRIRQEDGYPVFYRGVRVGLYGTPFRIFKFRTMVINADKIGGPSTSDNDQRIIGIGRWLRKYKLDELPQLINVLTGDMSIVGPRPEVKRYTDMYREEEKVILTVKPGITDWASIWNADEGAVLAAAEDAEKAYLELIRPKKLKLQMKYVRERSLRVDIKIIFLTILAILKPESQAIREIKCEK